MRPTFQAGRCGWKTGISKLKGSKQVRASEWTTPENTRTSRGGFTKAAILTCRGSASTDMNPELEAKLKNIPSSPGVYIYKDVTGIPIYVGKSKSLRNRVRTYFQDSRNPGIRLDHMMDAIRDMDYIVTDTEGEALALENNLIKRFKPKYNVLLRDDKTYPYIRLTINEPYPRAMITRRVRKDGAYYAGPFFPGGLARKTLKLIERYFLIRNCTIPIDGKRARPCLQYYIHRCLGPCVDGLTTFNAYQEAARDVKFFLEGRKNDLSGLIDRLESRMKDAALR